MECLSNLVEKLSIEDKPNNEEIEAILNDALRIVKTPQDAINELRPFLESLCKLLKSKDLTDKCTALSLEIIAELAKTDAAKGPCVELGLLEDVLGLLDDSNDVAVILQTLRCIGNICADNDPGRNVVKEKDGTRKIIEKMNELQAHVNKVDGENNPQLHLAACGSLLNLMTDSESLQAEATALGVVPFLLDFIQQSDGSSDCSVCHMAVNALNVLIDTADGKAEFHKHKGGATLVHALKRFSLKDDSLLEDILDILKAITAENDDPKLELVEAGIAEPLLNIVKKHEECNEENATAMTVLKSAADLTIFLLSGDESMKVLWEDSKSEEMMKELISWFSSRHNYIKTSAALASGNLARSDENCVRLLNLGVHEKLLSLLKSSESTQFSLHQAVLSALRNLAMPVQAKSVLIEAGLVGVVLPYLNSEQMAVQFKALATLRFIVAGQADSANTIGCNEDSCRRIIELGTSSGVEGVKAEATRLLAAVLKHANESDVIMIIIQCNGLSALVPMMHSEHVLMQNEALIALAVCVSSMSDEQSSSIQSCGCIPVLMKIIRNPQSSPQSCYNTVATLEALWLRGYFRDVLLSEGLEESLKALSTHNVQPVQMRSQVFLQRINNS